MKTCNLKTATIATLLVFALPIAQASEWTGNVGGFIGSKYLDDKDWSSLDRQHSGGFMLDVRKKTWPVSFTYDLIASGDIDEDGDLEDRGLTVENHFGIRKTFKLENATSRPYVGGGITFVWAEIKNETATTRVKDDDTGTGLWLGAGWLFDVTESFDLGIDARYSEAEVTIFDQDLEAGGLHYAVTASYHW